MTTVFDRYRYLLVVIRIYNTSIGIYFTTCIDVKELKN